MYRLTKELFDLLFENCEGIGLIDPQGAIIADSEYILEQHKPKIEGYWLWKRKELSYADLPMIMVKENGKSREINLEKMLVKSPSAANKKDEAIFVSSLSELFKIEPQLKKYLKKKTVEEKLRHVEHK